MPAIRGEDTAQVMVLTRAAQDRAEQLEAVGRALAGTFGDRLLTTHSARAAYAQSEAHHGGHLPDIVIRPGSIAEVQEIIRQAASLRVPVIAYGAGTSLEGNAAATRGGICIDLSEMDQISEIETDDMLCVVGPGVTRERLNEELRATGLFFPVDPGANATLVGMVATRASGTNAVRYGTMRDNTLALKVVTSDGSLIQTGTRARKSAAGYDLTHLFCGSEGTLGIIVEATLRLHPVPESIVAATLSFDRLNGAVQTVIAAMQASIPMARIELLDAVAVAACNAYSGLSLPARPTLFVEFHGSDIAIAEQIAAFESLSEDNGGGPLQRASNAEDRTRLWRARHDALPAARALLPNAVTWVTDVCVPLSHLAGCIERTASDIAAAGLHAPILGHVGDGNFHVFFVLQEDDEAGWRSAAEVNDRMIRYALECGGTCTGEHGIGIGKQADLEREHGAAAIAVMRRVKQALDPLEILNPGKIFRPTDDLDDWRP